jgi:hypothetical protein
MYLHKHFSANNVQLESFPFQREIAMEAYLLENPGVLSIESDEFNEVEIVLSEATLLNGREDKKTDGRIDILAKYAQEYLAIVELKLGQIETKHLDQLKSYLNERAQIIEKFPEVWDANLNSKPNWMGVIVGTTINPNLAVLIRNGCYHNDIPIAALTINRYKGTDGSVYITTDTYFPPKISGKDYTKYLFNGKSYGKGRLVLAVLQNYVENNPEITVSQLNSIFPKHLQGTEMFATETEAKGRVRILNFIKPNELIMLKDETIAVSNQWGRNITKFIDHCKIMGIKIEKVLEK